MEKLKAKLKKQGGFTMVELLIVVAIIAILVAVSIPMMNNALEKSRHAVDQANVRDAIGLISVAYTTSPDDFTATPTEYYYCVDKDTKQGYLSTTDTGAVTPQCTCGDCSDTDKLSVKLTPPTTTTIDSKPTIEVGWHFDGDKTVSGNFTTSP